MKPLFPLVIVVILSVLLGSAFAQEKKLEGSHSSFDPINVALVSPVPMVDSATGDSTKLIKSGTLTKPDRRLREGIALLLHRDST